MKSGLDLVQLAQRLKHDKENAHDFRVKTNAIGVDVVDKQLTINFGKYSFTPNTHATSQLSTFCETPNQYMQKLVQENPELAASNFRHGLSKKEDKTRMIRTIGNSARAFLSDSYRPLDNYDLLANIFPTIESAGLDIVSSNVSDTKLHVKMLSPKMTTEISKGDLVQYGLLISNSDVGAASLRIEPLLYRLVCSNGLICDTALKKRHLGKQNDVFEGYEMLSDETRRLTDEAFWRQANDIIRGSLECVNFEAQADKLRKAAGQEIKLSQNKTIEDVVEITMNFCDIKGEAAKNGIINALASGNQGAGLTRWGLINSVTATAQDDVFDYEQSIELERAASRILTLSPQQWERIAS